MHGGYVAAAFDELLGLAQSLSGQHGHDRSAHRPLPIADAVAHRAAAARAASISVDGRKIIVHAARIYAGDTLCAEAEGLFISIDPERFQELRELRDAIRLPDPSA